MSGGKPQRGQRNPKPKEMQQATPNPNSDGTGRTRGATESDQMLLQMSSISKDLREFKTDIHKAISDLTTNLKSDLREELRTFKQELNQKLADIGTSIQSQGQAIGEIQERISELEECSSLTKDSLLFLLKERQRLQDKVTDLESRSRRCNIRIYGIPEEMEGESMVKFIEKFLTDELPIPEGTELQIQRAHRSLAQKPAPDSVPRSVVVCFQQFSVKEMILSLAWRKKISIGNKLILFDHDYATEIMEKRRAYAGVKKALKEKGIRFQTPFTKIRIHWSSGTQTYKDAPEAVRELRTRGIPVANGGGEAPPGCRLEADIRRMFQWQRDNVNGAENELGTRVKERLQRFRRASE